MRASPLLLLLVLSLSAIFSVNGLCVINKLSENEAAAPDSDDALSTTISHYEGRILEDALRCFKEEFRDCLAGEDRRLSCIATFLIDYDYVPTGLAFNNQLAAEYIVEWLTQGGFPGGTVYRREGKTYVAFVLNPVYNPYATMYYLSVY